MTDGYMDPAERFITKLKWENLKGAENEEDNEDSNPDTGGSAGNDCWEHE